MGKLEDLIRPRFLARTRARDLLGFALLAATAAALLPSIGIDWAALLNPPADADGALRRAEAMGGLLRGVTRPMASFHMLLALGFLLCLRCGAIDLSLWAVSGLGGLVAAAMIQAHPAGPAQEASIPLALAAGIGAGAAVGIVNGLLVVLARLPSALATLLTAGAILLATHAFVHQRQIDLPDRTFEGWHLLYTAHWTPAPQKPASTSRAAAPTSGATAPASRAADLPATPPEETTEEFAQPLYVTAMLLAVLAFAAVMLVLMVFDWRRPTALFSARPWVLLAAMTASAALSAAGGAFWLVDQNSAPAPHRLIDGLIAPVAALLAGGAYFAGRGRTMIACLCVPPAVLLTTLWQRQVWNVDLAGYPLQLLLLGALVLLVHQAARDYTASRWAGKSLPLLSAVLGIAGAALLGASSLGGSVVWRMTLELTGATVWLISAAVLLIYRTRLA